MNKQAQQKSTFPAALEVSIAGWFLLIVSIWELIFNRLFTALGIYTNVGADGFLSTVADSGYFAMNATGIMALILACIMLPRVASNPRLAPLPVRIMLMLASPLYLPVVCVAVFRPISAALILVGYLVCTLSVTGIGIMLAIKKLDGGRRRIILAMALIELISAFELLASSYFNTLSQRAYMLSEALFIVTPIFAFFVFFKGCTLAFIRRPHLPALISAIIATTFAALIISAASAKTPLTMMLVAFRALGITMNVPGGPTIYLIALFFGTLAAGALILPSRRWPPSTTDRKVGLGLSCIWISGIQPTHPYQFILVLVGFLYLTRSVLEAVDAPDKSELTAPPDEPLPPLTDIEKSLS